MTPLQLAQLAAEVASGGIRYKPHFVKRIEALDGSTIKAYEPEVAARIPLTPEQIQILRQGACGVVNSPMGTAHKAAIPGIAGVREDRNRPGGQGSGGRPHQGRKPARALSRPRMVHRVRSRQRPADRGLLRRRAWRSRRQLGGARSFATSWSGTSNYIRPVGRCLRARWPSLSDSHEGARGLEDARRL